MLTQDQVESVLDQTPYFGPLKKRTREFGVIVTLELHRRAGEFVDQADIERWTDLSISTVERTLRELRKLGLMRQRGWTWTATLPDVMPAGRREKGCEVGDDVVASWRRTHDGLPTCAELKAYEAELNDGF